MRLNLYWRGRDVIDVEVHMWRRRDDDQPQGSAPKLEASGGGQAERADTYGDPATIAGFGFRSSPAKWRAPRDGGYHPAESRPEPTEPPHGPAGASR